VLHPLLYGTLAYTGMQVIPPFIAAAPHDAAPDFS
jgi:hypothetical protein